MKSEISLVPKLTQRKKYETGSLRNRRRRIKEKDEGFFLLNEQARRERVDTTEEAEGAYFSIGGQSSVAGFENSIA